MSESKHGTDRDGAAGSTARKITRRRVLRGFGATAGLVAAPAFLRGSRADAASPSGALFSLGVASGDPDAHSVVL
jgi:phosphodiesterase/alkaline phosphatase D-like protein